DSLVALLRRRASEVPSAELFSFLPDGEEAGAIVLTRGGLDRRARAPAARPPGRGRGGAPPPLVYPPPPACLSPVVRPPAGGAARGARRRAATQPADAPAVCHRRGRPAVGRPDLRLAPQGHRAVVGRHPRARGRRRALLR